MVQICPNLLWPNAMKTAFYKLQVICGKQRWSRGHKARGQGQGHKKNPRPRPRTAFPRTDTLEAKDRNARGRGQGHKRKCSPKEKKKKVFTKIFRRSPKKKRSSQKFFKRSPQKNVFQKLFQALHKILTIQTIVLSSSRGQANFRGLEASRPRPRTSKCVLEDSTSGGKHKICKFPVEKNVQIQQATNQTQTETKQFQQRSFVAILCFLFILLTILVLSFELVVSASARLGETWWAWHAGPAKRGLRGYIIPGPGSRRARKSWGCRVKFWVNFFPLSSLRPWYWQKKGTNFGRRPFFLVEFWVKTFFFLVRTWFWAKNRTNFEWRPFFNLFVCTSSTVILGVRHRSSYPLEKFLSEALMPRLAFRGTCCSDYELDPRLHYFWTFIAKFNLQYD